MIFVLLRFIGDLLNYLMSLTIITILTLVSFCALSCDENSEQPKDKSTIIAIDSISYHSLGELNHNEIVIDREINLNGKACKLPKDIILVFKGGIIKNGILLGNMTKIDCKGAAFDRVTIKGSWNIPFISTKLLKDVSYTNALKDVVALAHPKVSNTIIIEKNNYKVKAIKSGDACLSIRSNTDLIVKGTIQLIPNDFKSYSIIQCKGKNIRISGNGTLNGDKHSHLGTEGEWGMGVLFKAAHNASLSGLTIKDCWGDCIYVGGNSKNILIDKCKLDNGRRQGISVTDADSVTIKNCKISNVFGTRPEYAIDLEPNPKDTVDHVIIENVEVQNCVGGIVSSKGKKKAETKKIGSVQINNCSISGTKKRALVIKHCDSAIIESCKVIASNEFPAISTINSKHVIVRNNTVKIKRSPLFTAKNKIKEMLGKGTSSPIEIINSSNKNLMNNKVKDY